MPLIEPTTIIFGSAIVAALMLIFGFVLHSAFGALSCGPIANALLLITGFFGSLYLLPTFGVQLYTLSGVVYFGLAGACSLIFVVTILRAVLTRLLRTV